MRISRMSSGRNNNKTSRNRCFIGIIRGSNSSCEFLVSVSTFGARHSHRYSETTIKRTRSFAQIIHNSDRNEKFCLMYSFAQASLRLFTFNFRNNSYSELHYSRSIERKNCSKFKRLMFWKKMIAYPRVNYKIFWFSSLQHAFINFQKYRFRKKHAEKSYSTVFECILWNLSLKEMKSKWRPQALR